MYVVELLFKIVKSGKIKFNVLDKTLKGIRGVRLDNRDKLRIKRQFSNKLKFVCCLTSANK